VSQVRVLAGTSVVRVLHLMIFTESSQRPLLQQIQIALKL
jgi:hypothetical protein